MYDFEIFEIVSCTVDDVSKCDLRIFVEIWGICRVHLQEIDFKQVMHSRLYFQPWDLSHWRSTLVFYAVFEKLFNMLFCHKFTMDL